MRKNLYIWIIFCFVLQFCRAQDPQFSQFYATKMHMNPALTANTYVNRISMSHRDQWPGIPKSYVSSTVSYERRISQINSGLGIMAVRDNAGQGGLKFSNLAVNYAYKAVFTKWFALRLGLRYGRITRRMDGTNITFSDEILNRTNISIDDFGMVKLNYHDFSSGIMILTKKAWLGTTLDHLNRPHQEFTSLETRLPIKTSIHGGMELFSRDDKVRKVTVTSFTLIAQYKAQQKWDQMEVGGYFTKYPLFVGVWYRGLPLVKSYKPGYPNDESIIALAGLSLKGFRVGYSYDLTISKLAGNTLGAHEVTLVLEWPTPLHKLNDVRKNAPCPKFIEVEF